MSEPIFGAKISAGLLAAQKAIEAVVKDAEMAASSKPGSNFKGFEYVSAAEMMGKCRAALHVGGLTLSIGNTLLDSKEIGGVIRDVLVLDFVLSCGDEQTTFTRCCPCVVTQYCDIGVAMAKAETSAIKYALRSLLMVPSMNDNDLEKEAPQGPPPSPKVPASRVPLTLVQPAAKPVESKTVSIVPPAPVVEPAKAVPPKAVEAVAPVPQPAPAQPASVDTAPTRVIPPPAVEPGQVVAGDVPPKPEGAAEIVKVIVEPPLPPESPVVLEPVVPDVVSRTLASAIYAEFKTATKLEALEIQKIAVHPLGVKSSKEIPDRRLNESMKLIAAYYSKMTEPLPEVPVFAKAFGKPNGIPF